MAYDSLMVFTGNANRKLAADVVKRLHISLGRADVGRFSDGEISCEILEHVRGHDVFVLQSTCYPTNDNLMELMVMVDALKRASAGRITTAIPYFGYARQDRRTRSARVAITAKVVANMLQTVGVQRVLTVDLHADQIQGFFDIHLTIREAADRGPAHEDVEWLDHFGRQFWIGVAGEHHQAIVGHACLARCVW